MHELFFYKFIKYQQEVFQILCCVAARCDQLHPLCSLVSLQTLFLQRSMAVAASCQIYNTIKCERYSEHATKAERDQ